MNIRPPCFCASHLEPNVDAARSNKRISTGAVSATSREPRSSAARFHRSGAAAADLPAVQQILDQRRLLASG
jgi:hypothetical protein